MKKPQATYQEQDTIVMSETAIRRALDKSSQDREEAPTWVAAAWVCTHLLCVGIGWIGNVIYERVIT